MGFHFIQKEVYRIMKDSTKIVVMKWKCRNCSAMKTEKECLCYQEVEERF